MIEIKARQGFFWNECSSPKSTNIGAIEIDGDDKAVRADMTLTAVLLETAPKVISPAWWADAQQQQLRLCQGLEEIADSLPSGIHQQKCLYAARILGPLIKTIHDYEEKVLFPALQQTSDNAADCAKTLTRLKFEHFEDECFAEELAERLMALGSGDATINMEATGYMLRGFFEAIRRHVAFEREHLTRWTPGSV